MSSNENIGKDTLYRTLLLQTTYLPNYSVMVLDNQTLEEAISFGASPNVMLMLTILCTLNHNCVEFRQNENLQTLIWCRSSDCLGPGSATFPE
jgi:hypothetical protein